MKVYVVTSGEYSDYGINAVFIDEEQAKLYCATYERDYPTIEEFDTDDHKIKSDNVVKRLWEVDMYENGTPIRCRYSYTFKSVNNISHIPSRHDFYKGYYQIAITLDNDIPREKAFKIIHDKIATWKYEHQEEVNFYKNK